jgi:3-ketosteroid 9alpha-monooxygenase subunit A
VRGLKREPYGLSLDYVMDSEAEDLGVGSLSCRITGLSLLNQLFDLGQVQTMFLHSFTPVDEERTVQTARLYISDVGSDEIIEQIGRPWIERFVFEVEQDLKVLDYKKHLSRPVLCAGDGPIMKFREYAAQFYA